jgi:hypothetical protein
VSTYQPSSGGGFCRRCRSHFCPHVAARLYRPPFTKRDELRAATAAWEQEARRQRASRLDNRNVNDAAEGRRGRNTP